MVICPVAIAVGCEKCPVFKICPAKGIIGNQKKPNDDEERSRPKSAPSKAKRS